MSFPFTPAQIAALRSALSALSDAIEQGDKALADEQFAALMQKSQGTPPTTEIANELTQEERQQTKDVFSIFSWFGKKRKSDNSTTSEVTETAEPFKSIKLKPTTFGKTRFDGYKSDDPRIVGRYLADLPWQKERTTVSAPSEAANVGHAGNAIGLTSPPAQFPGIPGSLIQDNRISSRFFSNLPWESSTLINAADSNVLAETPLDEAASTVAANYNTSSLQSTFTAQFFSGLPWSVKSDSIENSQENLESYVAQTEIKPEITVTINLKERTSSGTSDTAVQEQAPPIKSYFSNLPWDKGNRPLANAQGEPSSSNPADLAFHENDDEVRQVEKIHATGKSADKSTLPLAITFFSRLPCDGPLLVSAVSIDTDQSKLISGEDTSDVYFQSLPWQGGNEAKQPFSSEPDLGGSPFEAQGIFALATQSALRASKKGHISGHPQGHLKMEAFFKALPWNGNRQGI